MLVFLELELHACPTVAARLFVFESETESSQQHESSSRLFNCIAEATRALVVRVELRVLVEQGVHFVRGYACSLTTTRAVLAVSV